MTKLQITYKFEFKNKQDIDYLLEIDEESMVIIPRLDASAAPEWTTLAHSQCASCPLSKTKFCPIALNLWDILDRFKGVQSFQKTKVCS